MIMSFFLLIRLKRDDIYAFFAAYGAQFLFDIPVCQRVMVAESAPDDPVKQIKRSRIKFNLNACALKP